MILIRRGERGASRVGRLVTLIAEEAAEQRPGRELILERLVEALHAVPAREGRRDERGLQAVADAVSVDSKRRPTQ